MREDSTKTAPGYVEIRVTQHPIETVVRMNELDAIVSIDVAQLRMSGGVAEEIRRLTGDSVLRQAERLAPLRVGDVAVTAAGDLPIRFILHAASADFSAGIIPTERTIRQLARGILTRCEALEIRRIAIPLFGTGATGFSAAEFAELVAESLFEHLGNPTILESVIFSIPEPEITRSLVSELAKLFMKTGKGGKPVNPIRIVGDDLHAFKWDVEPLNSGERKLQMLGGGIANCSQSRATETTRGHLQPSQAHASPDYS